MSADKKKQPTYAERLAQAARDEMPNAAHSGLITGLIADAQPRNAMMGNSLTGRRLYQPALASMEAMNPLPEGGFVNAMSDLYDDPRRVLPGSGGWTEGAGAALPHLAAAGIDSIAGGMMGRAAAPVTRNAMVESGNALSGMRLPAVPYRHPTVLPQGPINPQFKPTGNAHTLQLRGVAKPTVDDASPFLFLKKFDAAIRSGRTAEVELLLLKIEDIVANPWRVSDPSRLEQLNKVYDYMSDVMNNKVKTTRHLPGYQPHFNRSSNSNAPTLGGAHLPQPGPHSPVIKPGEELYDPEGFIRRGYQP